MSLKNIKSSILLALSLALALPLPAFAQLIGGSQCEDRSQSMMWKVQSADMAARGVEVHLFGSIHVGKAEFYPLHPKMESIFRSADNLVFEIDPQAASNPQTAMQLALRGMLPAGQTLDQVISAEALDNLEQVLKQLGIPMQNLMTFKPWMVALTLSSVQVMALGYNPQYGLEMYLISQKSSTSKILELESLDDQLAMLEGLNPEMFLNYTLEEFDQGAEIIEQMMSAWLCADKESLLEVVSITDEMLADASVEEERLLEELFDSMFTKRNIIMADGVEQYALNGQGKYFVVVGSGHLLGEGSVVDLLQDKGYQVTPVMLEP